MLDLRTAGRRERGKSRTEQKLWVMHAPLLRFASCRDAWDLRIGATL